LTFILEEEYDYTHGHEQLLAPLQSFWKDIKIAKMEITRNRNELYEPICVPLQQSVLRLLNYIMSVNIISGCLPHPSNPGMPMLTQLVF
jgi:hypothetical protein